VEFYYTIRFLSMVKISNFTNAGGREIAGQARNDEEGERAGMPKVGTTALEFLKSVKTLNA